MSYYTDLMVNKDMVKEIRMFNLSNTFIKRYSDTFEIYYKGLRKLILNSESIAADLDNTWAVVAEAIQTILRREAYPNPYEALKALTRTNTKMTEETIHEFVQGLDVSDEVKAELMAITPHTYTGI